ncbi:MAG: penicillin acylase family protein, partial [Microcystaceae cyanobacterium]
EQSQKLKIRQSNGGYQELEWVTQKSVQGMIISQQQDHAYALRMAGLERPNVIAQFWQMAKTKNLQDFEKALSSLQLPMFNILYSDIKGNIFYLHNAIAPKRKAGNWQDWQKIQPGDSDENLWTEYHPYSTLPKLTNPKTGWLQNTNDPPWTSTFPSELDPKNYPPDLAGSSLVDAENIFRTQGSLKLLKDSSKLSLEDIIKDKFSSRLEISDRLLPLLIPAAKMLANPLGLEAAEVLKKWDRQANSDSRGMVLFMLWVSTLDTNRVFSKPWQEANPLDTPSGLADINTALAVLEGVAAQVKLLYGSLDVSWGEVATMQQGKYQLPASGASGKLGSFRVLNFATTADQKFRATFGDSYIAVIEFSDPIQAKTLMVYGNSSQPNSPHLGDQLSLYSKNQLRPVWRKKAEILEHLEAREVIPLNLP